MTSVYLLKPNKENLNIFKILGVEMSDDFIKNTLSQLQIKSKVTSNKITFKSPSWRYDLERPIDLIEELLLISIPLYVKHHDDKVCVILKKPQTKNDLTTFPFADLKNQLNNDK